MDDIIPWWMSRDSADTVEETLEYLLAHKQVIECLILIDNFETSLDKTPYLRRLVDRALKEQSGYELERFVFHLSKVHFDSYVYMMTKAPYLVNLSSKDGWTVLHYFMHVNVSRVPILFQLGANVNVMCVRGDTPLRIAYLKSDESLVLTLLKHGAGVLSNKYYFLTRGPIGRLIRRCGYLSLVNRIQGLLDPHKRILIDMLV